MRTFKFVPSVCKPGKDGQEPKFTGQMEVDIPMFEDRYRMIEESGFEVDQNGEARSTMKKLGPIIKLATLGSALVKHVAITRKADPATGEPETHYASFDDIKGDPACDGITLEFGALVLNGFRLSGN
jgi:hypothetical protein